MTTLLIITHILGSMISIAQLRGMGIKFPRWGFAVNAASLGLYLAIASIGPWASAIVTTMSVLGMFMAAWNYANWKKAA